MVQTRMIIPVQSPCLIAYRDPLAGYFWLRPYVDMKLKAKIWGIAIHGLVFRLVHEEDGDWNSAQELSDSLSRAAMPSTTALDVACTYQRDFNATVEILNGLKIKAEPWRKGAYWSTEDDGDKATVMYMAKGRVGFEPKDMSNGYVRLVSRYVTKKPIEVGYPLAYVVDGQIKISSEFRPELRDKLWGLHVGKKFLCMKLTYEPNKMTVDKGFELSKSLSTPQLLINLPEKENVDDVAKEKDSINDTLAKLSAYGVNVDLIYSKDLIWLTRTLYEDRGFLSYNYSFVLNDQPCFCRMFAKNKGKTDVIG